MKTIFIGISLLFVLTIAFAGTGSPVADSKANSSTQQSSSHSADAKIAAPAPSHVGHSPAIMTHAEADALSLRGDSLMAQSEVSDIKVGAIGNDDLIYILVVILLVVVIVAVVR